MTFFMHRLAEALGSEAPDELPMPSMRPSVPEAFIVGSDRHVALRALAEQLVCEANAVIADPVSHLVLFDEVVSTTNGTKYRAAACAARISPRLPSCDEPIVRTRESSAPATHSPSSYTR